MTILPNGVAILEGDTHHERWCATAGLVHDRWFAREVCQHLKPGDVAIDGGAHIGALTRAMLDTGAHVLAFEPNPEAAACLRQNCPEATCANYALGARHGRARLIPGNNPGTFHLAPGHDIMVRPIDYFYLTSELEPTLIRLDIEGAERTALLGARFTIANCRPVLIVKVNPHALHRFGDTEDTLLTLLDSYRYTHRILQPHCRPGDPHYDLECLPI